MTDGIIVALLLALAGYLYSQEQRRAPDALTGKLPLSVAGPMQAFERGGGPNLAAPVAAFTRAHWRLDRVAIALDAAVAPDGSKTAARLVETADYGRHRIETELSAVTPDRVYTLSIYVKPVGRAAMQFEMRDQTPDKSGIAQFNFNDAGVTYTNANVTNAGMQALPDGWFRCWAAMPYSGATAAFNFSLLGMHAAFTYAGNSSAGLLIWGVQFEPGDRPRGYVGAESHAAQ
jgi:hypothetical protein